MTKKRDRSELEALRGKNKKLESVIKDLTKQVGRSKKRENRIESLEQDLHQQLEEAQMFNESNILLNKCPKCDVGNMDIIDLEVKKILLCKNCRHRQVIK